MGRARGEAIRVVIEAIRVVIEAIHDVIETIRDADKRPLFAEKTENVGFSAFFKVSAQSNRKIDGQDGTPGVPVPDDGMLL